MASQGVPLLGCPADRESAHDVAVIAACPQVAPGRPAVVTLEEAPVVEVGRLPDGLDERMPPTTLFGLVGVRVAQCDVGLVGQVFDRPGEVQVLHLADKVDDVALHLTAEAVEDRLLLADRERRRLLAVERAKAHPLAAALLELRVLGDDADDVALFAYSTDVVVEDPHGRRN